MICSRVQLTVRYCYTGTAALSDLEVEKHNDICEEIPMINGKWKKQYVRTPNCYQKYICIPYFLHKVSISEREKVTDTESLL